MADSQNKDNLPKTPEGNIDWKKYYDDITPKMKVEDLQKLKGKNSPFTPEYTDELNPDFLIADKDLFKTNDSEGNIDFVDSLSDKNEDTLDILEKDEDIDRDFIIDNEEINEDEKEIKLYKNPLPSEGDLFLIVIDEDGEIIDKLIHVISIQKEEGKVVFTDEEKNQFILFINEDSYIILDSDEYNYRVIDFEKIQEIDIEELNENDIFITKDIYPEIELDVDELKEKSYTLQERKESLITELISLFKAHNNKSVIRNICEISEEYVSMIKKNKDIKSFDYSNKLPFLKKVQKNNYHFHQLKSY